MCYFCFRNGAFVVLCGVGPFLLSCFNSLIAVFVSATKFNSDVSKWKTDAVTNMEKSKCNNLPPLYPSQFCVCHPALCFLIHMYDVD